MGVNCDIEPEKSCVEPLILKNLVSNTSQVALLLLISKIFNRSI